MRFRYWALVLAIVTALGPCATRLTAAPALKGEAKSDTLSPDRLVELAARAVRDGKLPAADEQKVRDSVRNLLQRVTKAADADNATLAVEFNRLERPSVERSFEKVRVANAFVVAGDVRGTAATDSVIVASGEIKFTSVTNCVLVGKTVRFTGARNCVVVATEFIRGTGVDLGKDDAGRSVLVSGQWIRLTSAAGAICHVLRPGTDPAPDDPRGMPSPAIRMTSARDVVFLNLATDVRTTSQKNCRHVELNSPLDR
jgi:hypothetical protein